MTGDGIISFTHLLALDVEATCDDGGAVPRHEMEIIEIGAVIANASCEAVDEFQTFVRPIRHPRLAPFCTGLTAIGQADVDSAPLFPQAMAAFKAWFSRYPDLMQWGSWGDYDKKQLEQDCALHGLSSSAYLPGGHVNLKEAFARALGLRKKPGLGQAVRMVGLEFAGTHHRGIDDARNIGRLLPYVVGKGMLPPPSSTRGRGQRSRRGAKRQPT
jgi:inhibitor of KinA sporulation pathway (predicted exonuclease)